MTALNYLIWQPLESFWFDLITQIVFVQSKSCNKDFVCLQSKLSQISERPQNHFLIYWFYDLLCRFQQYASFTPNRPEMFTKRPLIIQISVANKFLSESKFKAYTISAISKIVTCRIKTCLSSYNPKSNGSYHDKLEEIDDVINYQWMCILLESQTVFLLKELFYELSNLICRYEVVEFPFNLFSDWR